MPTGYTAQLDQKGWDSRRWMLEGVSRAFGICVMLRDDGHLRVDEIVARLRKDSEGIYHKNEIAKAKKNLRKFLSMSDADWKKLLKHENDKINRLNNYSINKAKTIKKKHDKAREDLQKIIDSDAGEITKNIAKYGLEQLDTVEDECEPLLSRPETSIGKLRRESIDEAKRDIEYHTKELKEEEERNKGRLEEYLQLIKDVNSVLGD